MRPELLARPCGVTYHVEPFLHQFKWADWAERHLPFECYHFDEGRWGVYSVTLLCLSVLSTRFSIHASKMSSGGRLCLLRPVSGFFCEPSQTSVESAGRWVLSFVLDSLKCHLPPHCFSFGFSSTGR